jgi:DNA-binding CsgD family transcriptional regulator/PAS domain-containing protein
MRAPARPYDEAAQVSSLIGDIYDASLDPALWPSVLEEIAGFLTSSLVNFFSQDALIKTANVYYVHGIAPTYLQAYFDTYVSINPMFPATLFFEVGKVVSQDEIIPRSELNQTLFFREWLQPQGWVDAMAAVLEKSATSCAVVAVGRNEREGLIDDEAKRRMGLIVPHLRRALLIGKVIDLHKVEAAALADTLDGLAAAMYLVDAAGRIVHANAAAHGMLENASVVRAPGGKFAATDARADQILHDFFLNAESGDTAVGTSGIAVPLIARDGERYVAHVLPLTSGARRRAGVAYAAVAAVFVRKAALDLLHPLEVIANTFKLTTAEMRVLMMIMQFSGVGEIAPALGLSEATVKTHLQRIFAKTDTNRQADLVKLVAGYMSPLGGPTSQ